MDYTCFLVEPTQNARYWLRRFRYSNKERCPAVDSPYSYHNARTFLCDAAYETERDEQYGREFYRELTGLAPDPSDPRWPTACEACGAPFTDEDEHQLFFDIIYRNPENGMEWPLRDLPVGAMYDSRWMADAHHGEDGKCLTVKIPGGEWMIDHPARDGQPWTRTGTPPRVTARPSILAGNYHAFLTDGVLRDI